MDVKIIHAVLPVAALFSFSCFAGQSGVVHFFGKVVESACWSERNHNMVVCQKNNQTQRHIINQDRGTEIISHHAIVEKQFLNESRTLELMKITYD